MKNMDVYDIERFSIIEDNCDLYDNLEEIIEVYPSSFDFEKGSEWDWAMRFVDEDGDSYHWGIQTWFDYGDEIIGASLRRLYIGSGSPQKNPSPAVITIAYDLQNASYPGDTEFDNISEILIEMIYQKLSEL